MLKFQPFIAAALGLVVVVPVLRSQNQKQGLERSLAETVRALDVLAGIQRGIEARHPGAIALAKQATENASGDARVRDNRLVTLRDEVNRLQAMSDRLDGGATQAREVQSALSGDANGAEGSAPRVIVSTGLTPAAREELAGLGLPGVRALPGASRTGSRGTSASGTAGSGNAATPADPLRQAQVLYRAERFEECAVLLRKLDKNAEASWWRARALEHLDRVDEALECYRQAKEGAPKDSRLAARAQQDLEFLEWKRSFEKKLEKNDKNSGAAGAKAEKP